MLLQTRNFRVSVQYSVTILVQYSIFVFQTRVVRTSSSGQTTNFGRLKDLQFDSIWFWANSPTKVISSVLSAYISMLLMIWFQIVWSNPISTFMYLGPITFFHDFVVAFNNDPVPAVVLWLICNTLLLLFCIAPIVPILAGIFGVRCVLIHVLYYMVGANY